MEAMMLVTRSLPQQSNEKAPCSSFLSLFLRNMVPHVLHPPSQQSHSLSAASASGTRASSSVFCNKHQPKGSTVTSSDFTLITCSETSRSSPDLLPHEHQYQRLWSSESCVRGTLCWGGDANKTGSQKESIVLFSECSEKLPVISSHPVMASSFVCNLSLKAVSVTTCQGVAAPLFRGSLITWCHGTSVWTVWVETADAVADGRFGETTTQIKRKQKLFKQSSFGTNLQAPAKTQRGLHILEMGCGRNAPRHPSSQRQLDGCFKEYNQLLAFFRHPGW